MYWKEARDQYDVRTEAVMDSYSIPIPPMQCGIVIMIMEQMSLLVALDQCMP